MATPMARSMTLPRRMNALKSLSMSANVARMPMDRLVPLEGALNFRDLGGYTGLDGRTVRWGRVFRSDALHTLSDVDRETLRSIGLRAIYDLRKSHERRKQPTALPANHG